MANQNTITVTNPTNDDIVKTYTPYSDNDVINIIDQTHAAHIKWRQTDFAVRADCMRKLGNLLRDRADEFALLMTTEMGKVKKQAVAEIEKCADCCDFYADNGADYLADEMVETTHAKSFITYQPIGVVLAVMPWNFPFWQVIRFAAPTLMAGNGAVLKHASSVTGCSLALEQLFIQAGFPPNLFRSLIIPSSQVDAVIENPKIRAVTLTGSTTAGKSVAAKAGECLKKTVLELGGSDAYIILEDADIDLAAKICADGRLMNAGQSCIAAKRFLVVEGIYNEFLTVFTQIMRSKKMGDPLDKNTDIASLSSIGLRDGLHEQVQKSINAGAKCILGGEIPDQPGAWYPPTILTNVKPGMPAYDDELFGPVASVICVRDEEEAIDIANSSIYGLGGGVFTSDIDRGINIARTKMDTGNVAVNGFVASNPKLPFGGVKHSGYGRELSRFGIHEFVNIKTVTMP